MPDLPKLPSMFSGPWQISLTGRRSQWPLGRALGSSRQLDCAINVNEFMDGLITTARQAVTIVPAPDQPITL